MKNVISCSCDKTPTMKEKGSALNLMFIKLGINQKQSNAVVLTLCCLDH